MAWWHFVLRRCI